MRWSTSKSREEQLVEATKDGDRVRVSKLINEGANVNYRNSDGQASALDCAVIVGKVELVNLLLDNGADVYGKTGNGYTALMVASRQFLNDPDIVDTLIRHGADVNAKSSIEQWTPLLLAAANVPINERVVTILIQSGARVNDSNALGWTALMYAAEFGSSELVHCLLKNGADPRLRGKDGMTALHMAAMSTGQSYLDALQTTVKAAATIVGLEASFHQEGAQFLADGFSEGNRFVRPKVVELLLEYGADADAETEAGGLTPLTAAIVAGNTQVVAVLIEHANIHAGICAGGETALMTAVWHNRVDIVRLLIEKGVDVNHRTSTGENALEWAIVCGLDDIARILIAAGAQQSFSDSFLKLASEREGITLTLNRLDLSL